MMAVPIDVIPKPHLEKHHLIMDQSLDPYSPNSFILHEDVAVPLDDLHDLGVILQNVHVDLVKTPSLYSLNWTSHKPTVIF